MIYWGRIKSGDKMNDINIYNKLFLEYSKLGLDKKRDIFNEELIHTGWNILILCHI